MNDARTAIFRRRGLLPALVFIAGCCGDRIEKDAAPDELRGTTPAQTLVLQAALDQGLIDRDTARKAAELLRTWAETGENAVEPVPDKEFEQMLIEAAQNRPDASFIPPITIRLKADDVGRLTSVRVGTRRPDTPDAGWEKRVANVLAQLIEPLPGAKPCPPHQAVAVYADATLPCSHVLSLLDAIDVRGRGCFDVSLMRSLPPLHASWLYSFRLPGGTLRVQPRAVAAPVRLTAADDGSLRGILVGADIDAGGDLRRLGETAAEMAMAVKAVNEIEAKESGLLLRLDVEADPRLHAGILGSMIDALGRYRLLGGFIESPHRDPIVFLHVTARNPAAPNAPPMLVRMPQLRATDDLFWQHSLEMIDGAVRGADIGKLLDEVIEEVESHRSP